jgi:hypothetical protein
VAPELAGGTDEESNGNGSLTVACRHEATISTRLASPMALNAFAVRLWPERAAF